jgi:prepilin-type processing-associated H-X9-DG protein
MKRHRKKLLIAALLFVGGVQLFFVIGSAREKARRINCAGNMKCILLAMLMHSGENDGELPMTLIQLRESGNANDGRVWGCPSRPVVATTIETTDYVYVGAGMVDYIGTPSRVPLMHDKADNHGHEWINVGFVDGHAEGFEAADFASLAASQGWIVGEAASKARHPQQAEQ